MARKEDSKLNIAIIHPDLGIGGAERLIVDAAVELASHGHNVHIFTAHHDKNRCFEETVSGTFQVTVCGAFLPQHIFYHLHAVVFYCHFSDLLLAQHTTFLRRLYKRPIDFIEEIITGMADMILVNGKFTASTFANTVKHLHTQGIRPAVLYPAVNVDQFDEPQSFKLNFLSINCFERKRNVDLAVSAFAMLQNLKEHDLQNHDLKHSTLTIAGGSDKRLRENVEYLGELKSLAEREGVSHQINFVASCSTAERNDEQFDIVPLEAMAAYKPFIACNNGGPVEAVKDGVTGFLCSPIPQEFFLTMAKLIRDPPMVERMGVEARKHVTESFSTKIFCQRLNQYLSNIASYP